MSKVTYLILTRTKELDNLIRNKIVAAVSIPGSPDDIVVARHGVNRSTLLRIAKNV